ncbi:MAG TPA: ATP-binding protein [Verrucomicrobiae bacterium]|nr:ATP-binding protein [Verrucomicrobiae bacterium]
MTIKSIRWQLQLWYGLILLAVLVGFGVTAYQLQSARQWRQLDLELERRAHMLAGAWRPLGPRERPPMPGNGAGDRFNVPERPPFMDSDGRPDRGDGLPRFQRPNRRPAEFRITPHQTALFDDGTANDFYYAAWNREGVRVSQSTNAPSSLSRPELRGPRGVQSPETRDTWREVLLVTPQGDSLLVGGSILPEQRELRKVAVRLATVGAVILIFGLAGGGWLAARATRPIRSITETANRISGGDLSHRISVADTESELGELAGILNGTFARLEAAFGQQKQFTSDAAHELRTPVSVMLTQTQSALNRERSADEYRATIEACHRSAQRMRRLLESLLELARLDAGQENLRRSAVNLAPIAGECIDQLRPLASDKQIQITVDLRDAPCVGDSERLGQVITNLVSNAIHYNRERGNIHVKTRSEQRFAIVEVVDDGPGISSEHQANVFKRFYRIDAARTSAQGHSGLGLAICRSIVEAHGGTIDVRSREGQGTTFVVRLPSA